MILRVIGFLMREAPKVKKALSGLKWEAEGSSEFRHEAARELFSSGVAASEVIDNFIDKDREEKRKKQEEESIRFWKSM